jgi:hypothetical protein
MPSAHHPKDVCVGDAEKDQEGQEGHQKEALGTRPDLFRISLMPGQASLHTSAARDASVGHHQAGHLT